MNVEPYLFFDGRCEEALDFYKSALGAKVQAVMRFKESPEPLEGPMAAPENQEKVMHACFTVGDTAIMASDGNCSGTAGFEGFSLAINVADAAAADRLYNALAEGGTVQMPIGETFWSPRFGMVADKFGVSWMVMVHAPEEK